MYSHSPRLSPLPLSASGCSRRTLYPFPRRAHSDVTVSEIVLNAAHTPPVSKLSEYLCRYIWVRAFACDRSMSHCVCVSMSELDNVSRKLVALETPQQPVCQLHHKECEYVG